MSARTAEMFTPDGILATYSLIGSIRRECLNHFIILNSRHLKKTLASYFCYYHRSRTYLALSKQCPIDRQVMKDGMIVAVVEVGGLHHRYERVAA